MVGWVLDYIPLYSNSKQVEATLGGQLARIGKLVALRALTILHHKVDPREKRVTQEQDYNMDSRTTC